MKYINTGNKILDDFTEYYCRNKLVFRVLVLIIFLTYGYEIANFTLSIDEEITTFTNSNDLIAGWISQGRFGIAFIKLIINKLNILPFWKTFLSVSILGLSVFIWCSGYWIVLGKGKLNKSGTFLFSTLFVTYPIHMEYIIFSTYNVEVSLGYVFVALSVFFVSRYCFFEKTKLNIILGVSFLTFALSIYQSFASVYIAGTCAYCYLYFQNNIRNQKEFSNKEVSLVIIKYVIVLIVSLIIYKVINMLMQLIYPPTGYVDSFMSWTKTDINTIINIIKNYIYAIITGKVVYGGYVSLPTYAVGFILIAADIIKRKRIDLITLILVGLLISPMLLTITIGGYTPLRAMQVLPFMIGSIWYIVCYSINYKRLKNLIVIILFLFVLLQSQATVMLSYSDHNRYEQDIALGHKIAYSIETSIGEEIPDQPVIYIGKHMQTGDSNLIQSEVIGHSFFEWDGGNQYRIALFMRYLGYNYILPSQEQIEYAENITKYVPSWPNKNSIIINDDMIIVKLSDIP